MSKYYIEKDLNAREQYQRIAAKLAKYEKCGDSVFPKNNLNRDIIRHISTRRFFQGER